MLISQDSISRVGRTHAFYIVITIALIGMGLFSHFWMDEPVIAAVYISTSIIVGALSLIVYFLRSIMQELYWIRKVEESNVHEVGHNFNLHHTSSAVDNFDIDLLREKNSSNIRTIFNGKLYELVEVPE